MKSITRRQLIKLTSGVATGGLISLMTGCVNRKEIWDALDEEDENATKGFIAGGSDGGVTNTAERYSEISGSWSTTGSIGTAINRVAGFSLGIDYVLPLEEILLLVALIQM